MLDIAGMCICSDVEGGRLKSQLYGGRCLTPLALASGPETADSTICRAKHSPALWRGYVLSRLITEAITSALVSSACSATIAF